MRLQLLVSLLVCLLVRLAPAQTTRPNVLLITADDMNFDTPGFAGGKVPGLTPNLDKLASEGVYFRNAHVTVAVCQPSRSVLMTGRYPHRNGAEGFGPIKADVPTLNEQLRAAGYINGIFAKVPHLAPIDRFCWDTIVQADALGVGRDPDAYSKQASQFFADAKAKGKPFFLMANIEDPHRPFSGSDAEKTQNQNIEEGTARPAQRRRGKIPPPTTQYTADQIPVPGWLPDLPDVRKELAQYYASAYRCDQSVGAILRALESSGLGDNTIVMFLSDNGMSEPGAKSNCYPTSTRTPWLVRWPGKSKAGQVDETHFISGIDFTPTILDALALKPIDGVDGKSIVPLLRGEDQPGRDFVVTVYHETVAKRRFEMRCVQSKDFAYIYNGWSDGKETYQSEPLGGLAFRAMKSAAATNPAIAERVKFILYRATQELYDLKADPDCLHSLIDEPASVQRAKQMRDALTNWMRQTHDPQLDVYARRIELPAPAR